MSRRMQRPYFPERNYRVDGEDQGVKQVKESEIGRTFRYSVHGLNTEFGISAECRLCFNKSSVSAIVSEI